MDEDEKKQEFIKEQYSQYWEMLRQHTAFSWQIPALAVVAVIFFLGLDPNRLSEWTQTPLVPAIAFLVLSLFIGVMLIHHRRNLLFVNRYEQALIELEKRYGQEIEVHHSQISPKLKGWQRVSSSTSLSVFLLLLAISLLTASIYFFIILAL